MLRKATPPPALPAEAGSGGTARARLLALTIAATGCLMSVGAALIFLEARASSERLYDYALRETGVLLLQLAQHEINEHGRSLGVQLVEAETEHDRNSLRFQVWTDDMRAAYRSADSPAAPFAPLDASGFGWTSIDGAPWRSFAVWNRRHTLQLQIVESEEYRQMLPRAIFWRLAVAMALLLPLSIALLWWIIARSLRSTRALARMRETLAFERRFTSDAAHELRTPLAAIRANTQVMQGARTPEEFTTASVNLLASVDRSGRLVEQLLALARVDASASLPQRFELVDLAPLVHAQIAEHERFAGRRHVEIEASTEPARVRGDRELLGVLLRNLVDNAIRYSRPQTRVVISCDTLADGVELAINDEGVGIVPEERTRIFERFYRASGTHDYGSGLGLSIVKRIADLHGASITVSTGAGQRGSCFTLWFPKPAAARPA
ncbi:MAG: sensor histidine kinase N-terminal domain-containing protein [Gammaproteobacteria bacterium]|nr:sensor histidine kinase N-terminal domain-containing protein [Gammaproteobacteria bacterium]